MIKQLCIFILAACTSFGAWAATDQHDNQGPAKTYEGASIGASEVPEEFSAFEEGSEQPLKRQAENRTGNTVRGEDIEHEWTPEEWYRVY